jgi:hypothetical protein
MYTITQYLTAFYSIIHPTIRFISTAALAKINSHQSYLIDEISLDNLLVDFFNKSDYLKFSQQAFEERKTEATRNGYDDQLILLDPLPSSEFQELSAEEFIRKINEVEGEGIPKITTKDLEDLGFTNKNLKAFRKVLVQENGALKAIGILTTLKRIKQQNEALYCNIKESFIDKSLDLS